MGVNLGIGSQTLADDLLTSSEGIQSSNLVPSATIGYSSKSQEMSSSNPSSSAASERLDERPPPPDSFGSNVSSDTPPSTSLTKRKKQKQLDKSSANEEYEVEDIIGF